MSDTTDNRFYRECITTPKPEASKRQLREDFEKWYGSKPSRFITGNYEDIVVQARWEAYRAGRESVSTPAQERVESLERKLFAAKCVMDTMQDGITFRDNRITELEKAIREARELVNLGSFEFAVEELTEVLEANK